MGEELIAAVEDGGEGWREGGGGGGGQGCWWLWGGRRDLETCWESGVEGLLGVDGLHGRDGQVRVSDVCVMLDAWWVVG